jgi:hypothetical protein
MINDSLLNFHSVFFRHPVYLNKSYIIVLFVETPRKFITAKLSIRKPGSSSVLIISKIRYDKDVPLCENYVGDFFIAAILPVSVKFII